MNDADTTAGGVGVVVVAAGSGARLGAGLPKAFVPVAGRPLVGYAVSTLLGVAGLRCLVVVVPASHLDPATWGTAEPWLQDPRVCLVAGGAERTDSVRAGLAALHPACDVVLVHDAARACTPLSVAERVVAAVRAGDDGAVPGLPVVDTIKTVDAAGLITGTPERALLRAVQTPQAFRAEVLHAAYASGWQGTDDAALVERLGHRVRVVDGDSLAFKVTTPEDLARAEALLAAPPTAAAATASAAAPGAAS